MNRQLENGKISASLMCLRLKKLEEDIRILEKESVEYLHIDVMDGEFVPNFGLGIDYINGIREMTDIPLDFHMMVTRPEEKIEWLKLRPQDQISIHYESTIHVQRTLVKAKTYGCKVFLAINPATPIYCVEEVLDYIDGITVLTVNPGFAGQRIVKSCVPKVKKLEKFLEEMNYPELTIEVDGNISFENGKLLRGLGADIFVAGSSSIFNGEDLAANIRKYREYIR